MYWTRSIVFRNTKQYLVENIRTKGLSKQLRSIGSLSDKESRQVNRFKGTGKELGRNAELLHLMMLLDNARFSTFRLCLRKTQQNLSATVLTQGRAVVKSYLKTNGESGNTKSFMPQKVINALNNFRDASKFTPQMKQLYDRFGNIGVELLDSSIDGDVLLWIWCDANSSLENLQKFLESNDLRKELECLMTLQISTVSVEHASSARVELFEDYAVVVGEFDGVQWSRDFLKINLYCPSEVHLLQKLPTSCVLVAAAVNQTTVYFVGLGKTRNEIWKYDCESGWGKCTSLVKGRIRHSVAFVDGVLYVCGGFIHADKSVIDSVEAYNSVINTCSSVGNLIIACDRSASCVYKGSLYIFGGCDKDRNQLSDVQVYDTKQNTCHLLSKPMPYGYCLMRAVMWQDSVILLGRWNCIIYNFVNDTWQTRKQFKTDVNYFGLALSNNRIYVIGGGTSETNETGKKTWRCRDDVRSVSVMNIFENKPAEWKFHVKLPRPCLISASGVICGTTTRSDNFAEMLHSPSKLYEPRAHFGLIRRINIDGSQFTKEVEQDLTEHPASLPSTTCTEDFAIIVGLDNGQEITNEVLKINLHRPSETHYVGEVPIDMQREATAAVYHNTVYVAALGTYADEIWKYETRAGWGKCASLAEGRRGHSAAFVDEVLFICGGFADEDESVLHSVEAYNAVTNTCRSAGKLVYPCESSGNCVSYKKSLYIFGGSDKDHMVISDVQVYDTVNNTCHLLPKPMPVAQSLMRAALWRESVILLGYKNSFVYDFITETWQVRKQFRTNVVQFGLAQSNDRIYVIGGGTLTPDAEEEDKWTCRDDMRSVAIEKIIENKPVEWNVHAKLPKPCLVHALGVNYGMNEDHNFSRNEREELSGNLFRSGGSSGSMKAINSGEDADNVLIIGLSDGLRITNDVLKINLNNPSEMYYVEEVSTPVGMEAAAAVYDNTVYVVGVGPNADEIWKYESNSGWNKCTFLYPRRRRHRIAFVEKVLYICGGFDDKDETVLDSVEAYNTVTNICISVGRLVYPCESSGNCVPYKKSLYIFGGSDKDGNAISDVQVYDTVQNTCHLLPKPMPFPHCLMRAALWRESVIILLGYEKCYIYDFMTKTWQVRDQFKTNVDHFGLALSNDRIYIIGGGTCKTDADGNDTWTCRDDVRSVAIEKIIKNKTVEWKVHAKLPKPCFVHAFAVVK